MKVNTLKASEPGYPTLLRHIHSPPAQLFWSGAEPASWLDKPRVAVVGSRKATGYGRSVTEKFVTELARAGVIIISGLAFGIDACAHNAALAAGGITVAVLPTSIEEIYPASHTGLARRIVGQGGSLVSEYPQGTTSWRGNFIARNRIVSGLADVLLITEAALKSGSLHTARFALEQGKTVMAVPGDILTISSEGCNNLIKSGAVPATSADDVFFALNLRPQSRKSTAGFAGTEPERQILELILSGVAEQEELALAADMDGSEISRLLTSLEIGGHIRPRGGGNWAAA